MELATSNMLVSELLSLSCKETAIYETRKRALVFWINEALTSIIEKEDLVNEHDFVVDKITNVRWKSRGKRQATIHPAKIIMIGTTTELQERQSALDEEIEKEKESRRQKRQRKTPSALSEFIVGDLEVTNTSKGGQKNDFVVLSKKREEAEKLFGMESAWSAVREAMDAVNGDCNDSVGENVPVVTFPESQVDLPYTPNLMLLPPEPILQPTLDLRTENEELKKRINLLEDENKKESRQEQDCKCKFLEKAGNHVGFLKTLLNCIQGSSQQVALINNMSPLGSVDTNCVEPGIHPNKVEIHPRSDVWVSSHKKSKAILTANGRPKKLVGEALRMLYSTEQLSKFSMHGQRSSTSIPEKEASAVIDFVLNICRTKDGKPALSGKEFTLQFNRCFEWARAKLSGKPKKKINKKVKNAEQVPVEPNNS